MRYTTLIDVTEIPEVWRNANTCRLYMYLALRSGYHDDDRDIVKSSLRTIAAHSGLTLSAVRHGLQVLQKTGLVRPVNGALNVTKFVLEQKITSRAKTKQQQQQQDQQKAREDAQKKLDAQLRQERRLREQGTEQNDAEVVAMYEQYQKEVKETEGLSRQIREAYLVRMAPRYNLIKAK